MSSSTMSFDTPAPNDPPPPPALPVMDTYQPVSATKSTDVPMQVINTAPTAQTETLSRCPPTYITLNVVAMLCLCFVFGLIGLTYSLMVESEWEAGNHEAARKASRNAHWWGGAAVVTGGGIFLVSFLTFSIMRLAALEQE